MTLRDAVSTCLSKYSTFSGRSSREEYWKFTAAYVIVIFGLAILYNITNWSLFVYVLLIIVVGSGIPFLALGVRRLHDIGKSGTWMLIRLVPIAGDFIFFIFTLQESQPFANAYGPSPRPGVYAPPYWAGQVPPMPEGSALPAPVQVADSELPFYQARRKAALEASARQRYESGEPGLDSHKVDEYFAHASVQKPARDPEPKSSFSFSTMSRKSLGLIAGGVAVAILILGIFLGANSWRPTVQDSVMAAAPAPPPALAPPAQPDTPTQQVSPSPSQTTQYVVPPPAAAPPSLPIQSAAPQAWDLGLTSPLRPVGCTGQFIVFYHSSIDPSAYAQDIQANLVSHPGSKYLVTVGSCSSLYPMSNKGTMIYAVYGGPFDTLAQACVAASRFADEAYVKVLDNSTPPDQAVRSCS